MAEVVFVDPEEDDDGLAEAAWDLASRSEIHVLSDKDVRAVAIEDGAVVGAVFDSLVSGDYSFDVVVDPGKRGRGVGRALIDAALQEFQSVKESGARLVLDVVNEDLVPLLQRRGLEVQQSDGGHIVMSEPGASRKASGPFVMQPGPGFRLNDAGTWDVLEVPKDVLESAQFSGHLTIHGYRCVVFDAPDGSTWAQKAQERLGTMLRRVAARLAR